MNAGSEFVKNILAGQYTRLAIILGLLFVVGLSSGTAVRADSNNGPDATVKFRVGDSWTYSVTDDITDTMQPDLVFAVTEVGDNQLTVRLTSQPQKAGAGSIMIFDFNWNVLEQGDNKYIPNDGRGLPAQVDIGTEWKSEFKWQNKQTGASGKGKSTSRCLEKEALVTKAGSFDAIRCVNQIKTRLASAPGVSSETEITTWYAPKTLRWVRRTFVWKKNGHVADKSTQELIAYTIKP